MLRVGERAGACETWRARDIGLLRRSCGYQITDPVESG